MTRDHLEFGPCPSDSTYKSWSTRTNRQQDSAPASPRGFTVLLRLLCVLATPDGDD